MQYSELAYTKKIICCLSDINFNKMSCILFGKPTHAPLLGHLLGLGAFCYVLGLRILILEALLAISRNDWGKVTVSFFGVV